MTNSCYIARWPNGKSLGWGIFAVGSNPVSGDFLFIYFYLNMYTEYGV